MTLVIPTTTTDVSSDSSDAERTIQYSHRTWPVRPVYIESYGWRVRHVYREVYSETTAQPELPADAPDQTNQMDELD